MAGVLPGAGAFAIDALFWFGASVYYVGSAFVAGLYMPPRRPMKITNRVLLQYSLAGAVAGSFIGWENHGRFLFCLALTTGWFTLWGFFVKLTSRY